MFLLAAAPPADFSLAALILIVPSTKMGKHATDRERARLHILSTAGKTQAEIAEITGFKQRHVSYLLKQPVTPRKRRGCPVLFDTPRRRLLVDFIKASPANRRLAIPALALQFGTRVTGQAIKTALAQENMSRRYALSFMQCRQKLMDLASLDANFCSRMSIVRDVWPSPTNTGITRPRIGGKFTGPINL